MAKVTRVTYLTVKARSWG